MAKVRSTDQYEKERKVLLADYGTFQALDGSEKLKRFTNLNEIVTSTDFINRKYEIEALKYKGSSLETDEKRWKKVSKCRKIKAYFHVHDSNDLHRFEALSKQEEELGKEDKRFYTKYRRSKTYRHYLEIKDSADLTEYNQLEERIGNKNFEQEKSYLKNKKRYELTEDFNQLEEYNALVVDPEIVIFEKYKDSDVFDIFKNWMPLFEEYFGDGYSEKEWSHLTPVAQQAAGKNIAGPKDIFTFTHGENIHIVENGIELQTNKATTKGVRLSEHFGFVEDSFAYSAATLNSLSAFTLKEGRIEMKLSAKGRKAIVNQVALSNDSLSEAIILFESDGKHFQVGTTNSNDNHKVKVPIKCKKPIILALEWKSDSLCWFVNGQKVHRTKQQIPNNNLGFILQSQVLEPMFGPANGRMNIEWIRAYGAK